MICGEGYVPDARTRRIQKACGKLSCRRARKKLADQGWRAKNPGYCSGRVGKMRTWALEYPTYWKDYRASHPDYTQRNRNQTRERMRVSRCVFAKQDAMRRDPVGYLAMLRPPALFAKQDAMAGSVDGIVSFLVDREVFAKPNDMVSMG
ncbi:MAG TPA: hypothetical protein PKX87_03895 [Alphaproteobacteria bacterium]|jgi:hypothetical protein|nr:hypothetical protein [Alphaproteobacteria bacterium]